MAQADADLATTAAARTPGGALDRRGAATRPSTSGAAVLDEIAGQRQQIEARVAEARDLTPSSTASTTRRSPPRPPRQAAAAAASSRAFVVRRRSADPAAARPERERPGGAGAAYSVIGTPYQFGGASPETGFDCSGLHDVVVGARGRVAPALVGRAVRGAAARRARGPAAGRPRSSSTRRSPTSAIYVGGGRMIHSPHTGRRGRGRRRVLGQLRRRRAALTHSRTVSPRSCVLFLGPMPATGTVASDEDLRLVAMLRAGDETAFMMLVERHGPSMLRIARMYVSTAAVAEEVVQDAWLGVLRGLDCFEGRSSLRTWIFRILVNIAKTRGQREARSVPFSSVWSPDAEGEPTVRSPTAFLPPITSGRRGTGPRSLPSLGHGARVRGSLSKETLREGRGGDRPAPAEPARGHPAARPARVVLARRCVTPWI